MEASFLSALRDAEARERNRRLENMFRHTTLVSPFPFFFFSFSISFPLFSQIETKDVLPLA
jgi:hypothetical protein